MPSLLAGLTARATRRANTIEKSLRLVAEALAPLPGAKTIVLVGYGFGQLNRSLTAVMTSRDYEAAEHTLLATRTSVVSIDVSNAEFHSLEISLQKVSEQTGGLYTRTFEFPQRALAHVAGALAGYYVLFVEKPDRVHGTHRIEVAVTSRSATVLARCSYDEQ